MKYVAIVCLGFIALKSFAKSDSCIVFSFREDVRITICYPQNFTHKKTTQLILFALPNGNSTEQTMGKKMVQGDDWHYDIQHIAAQTKFVREKNIDENIVVAYLENSNKSWPAWKKKHTDYQLVIPSLVDTIIKVSSVKKYYLHLNGHSGGGSFIFGLINSYNQIPRKIKRISFLDSNYGYDSSYTHKIVNWLKISTKNCLNIFAYNDSIAKYNGKPVVSATGGTWYRTKLMLKDLQSSFSFTCNNDSLLHYYQSRNKQINVFLKENFKEEILHTKQVELNGFVHSILINTKFENCGYTYFGERCYAEWIE